jgi:YesN/AraC family two-component response regulator
MHRASKALTVVIADDDATTRHALRLLLLDQGHQVVGEAADGEKAVELCLSREPGLVFIDINMPRLDGHAVAEKIRQDAPALGMVMITSTPTLDHVQRALRSGVSGFVVKPFNAAKVAEAIAQCVKQKN